LYQTVLNLKMEVVQSDETKDVGGEARKLESKRAGEKGSETYFTKKTLTPAAPRK
jgi:hypothetical protein